MCFSVRLSNFIFGSETPLRHFWTRSPVLWLRKFPCSPLISLFLLPRSNYGASYPRLGFTPVRAYFRTLSPSTAASFSSFHQQDMPDFRMVHFTCLLPRVAAIRVKVPLGLRKRSRYLFFKLSLARKVLFMASYPLSDPH